MNKIFVYGTLKKGHGNHRLLDPGQKKSEFVGEATIKGDLFSLGGFPGADLTGKGIIKGEVYNVPEETLKNLDRLEGHPSLFKRVKTISSIGEVEVYEYPHKSHRSKLITDGVWK